MTSLKETMFCLPKNETILSSWKYGSALQDENETFCQVEKESSSRNQENLKSENK